jgi:hypothetical protein
MPAHLSHRSRLAASSIALLAAGIAATAWAHAVVVAQVPSGQAAHRGFDLEQAEVRHCVRAGGRSWEDCRDEVEAKALIRRAEWVAQLDARRGVVRDARDLGDDLLEPDPTAPAPARAGSR